MTVSEFIYNLLFTAYPNRVWYQFFDDSANLLSSTPVILIRNTDIENETTKTGEAGDTATYEIQIIGSKESHFTALNLARDIRDILTAIKDTNNICQAWMDRQFEANQKEDEETAEVSRIIQSYTFIIEPNQI